jgi:hypothetical protein
MRVWCCALPTNAHSPLGDSANGRAHNVADLVRRTRVREVHARMTGPVVAASVDQRTTA